MKNELHFKDSIQYHLTLQYLRKVASNHQGINRGRDPLPPSMPSVLPYYQLPQTEYKTFTPPDMTIPWKPFPVIPFHKLNTITRESLHKEVNNLLSEMIDYLNYNEKDLKQKINRYIDDNIIAVDDIPWVDIKNHRQCLFIWYKFSKAHFLQHSSSFISPLPNTYGQYHNSIKVLETYNQLTDIPTIDQRMINVLESISLVETTKYEKKRFLELISNEFKSVESLESFSFMGDKNKEQWAISYLDRVFKKDNLYEYDIYNPLLNGNNHQVNKDIVILNFDIMTKETIRGKKEIIKGLKKAWQQRIHRKNLEQKNRKAYSFTLSNDIQKSLDYIKESWEARERQNDKRFDLTTITKNEIVETLINKELDRLLAK